MLVEERDRNKVVPCLLCKTPIRVGTPAVTTRGMKEEEMLEISDLIAEALANRTDEAALTHVRDKVREMTRRFPLPS